MEQFHNLVLVALLTVVISAVFYISQDFNTATQLGGADSQASCGSNFQNFCLTQRPRGYQQSLCTWWKNFHQTRLDRPVGRSRLEADPIFTPTPSDRKLRVLDYEVGAFNTNLDGETFDPDDIFKKRQSTLVETRDTAVLDPQLGGEAPAPKPKARLPPHARPEFTSYDPDYFNDASGFCQQHPRHRLCPNHWRGNLGSPIAPSSSR